MFNFRHLCRRRGRSDFQLHVCKFIRSVRDILFPLPSTLKLSFNSWYSAGSLEIPIGGSLRRRNQLV